MANYLSAGVYGTEIDLSISVPSVATGICAYAGEFLKGPAQFRKLITNTDELISTFGLPTNSNYNDWYQVANFLKYGNQIYVVRSLGDASFNGVGVVNIVSGVVTTSSTDESDIQIINAADYENKKDGIDFATTEAIKFIRKSTGDSGEIIKVSLSNSLSNSYDGTNLFSDIYEYSLATGELLLAVEVNDVLSEVHLVSLTPGATNDDGDNIFIEDVLANYSAHLYCSLNTTITWPTNISIQYFEINSGVYDAPTTGDLQLSYDLFAEPEEFDCSILIANEKVNAYVADMAKTRADVLAILGTTKTSCVNVTDPVQGVRDYVADELNSENSYAAFYGNYIKVYDKYNDKYRWVNIAGAVAGSQVRTNNNRDVWWANAGLDRGQISGVTEIAFNPNQGARDTLYKEKINPIVSFPGQGNCIIWGQKTLLSRPSAFDRVNVRQLFLVIEKAVNKVMKYFVFEANDIFTRAQVLAMVNPFLEDIKGRRGVYDYLVVCSDQNNTPEVIDRNELKLDVLLKPTRVAEFISVRYVATKTGVDLQEISKTLG